MNRDDYINNESTNSSLWKISSSKNGEKYLTFSGNTNINSSNNDLSNKNTDRIIINNNCDNLPDLIPTIRVYKIRWFILFVICLVNISNAINWIVYGSIADYTCKFYGVGYDGINFLSLIYLIIAIPAGFLSFWLIDNVGIRSSLNLGAWLNFIGSCVRVVSSIDTANGSPLIVQSSKYNVLLLGQCFCAFAQPFVLFLSTKFANTWFAEDQRSIANVVVLGSNTLGILIGAFISPVIVNSSVSFISEISLLNLITACISLAPAVLGCFIMRSTPKQPPSYGAIINANNETNSTYLDQFKMYFKHIKKLLKSKDFLILLISFGFSMGIFNALTTLIEQIFCTRGYNDNDAGYFCAALIIMGIFGSIVSGFILDKTKRFEELSKICFSMAALTNIFLVIIQLYNNDKSTIYYLQLSSFCLMGLFSLPLLPICMDMAVECVYPIPEAISTGLLFISGQIFGIIMILLYPKISSKVGNNSYIYNSVQTCTVGPGYSRIFKNNSAYLNNGTSLSVLDFNIPLYGQSVFLVFVSIFFTFFFKCSYLRLKQERLKLAEQILNSARFN